MCRWLAYTGAPILIADLIIKPKDSLIDQSLHARASRFPTNGDGFGIGWYDNQPKPGLFRSIRPMWNDQNLHDISSHIESHLFLAHIRAASLAPIQETNCHPFRYKKWLFVHNGQIAHYENVRQSLISKVSPKYFPNIQGSTDSEIMFHIALSYGMEDDVVSAVAEMVKVVEYESRKSGTEDSLWMTLGISDGESLWGFRYGSDGKGPSLYVSPGLEDLYKVNHDLKNVFGKFAACIVSEPVGDYQNIWRTVPDSSVVIVSDENIEITPFVI